MANGGIDASIHLSSMDRQLARGTILCVGTYNVRIRLDVCDLRDLH